MTMTDTEIVYGPPEPSHGLCTCCTPPRPATQAGEREEWGHDDRNENGEITYAEMRHVHYASSSSDCDGRYHHATVYRLNGLTPGALARPHDPDGYEPGFDRLWQLVLGWAVPAGGGTLEVYGWNNVDGLPSARFHAPSDEGGTAGEYYVCDDPDCAYEDDEYRDFTAERAGY